MDDKRYLLSMIREGEHQQQDFKYRVADACKLAKSVSAFANTDGGRLLIGVRDDGHLALWRESQKPQGAMITYNDDIRRLLDAIQSPMTLNQIVRMARLPRHKVITLMARLIRFGTLRWEYTNQQFLFSQL